MGTKYEVQAEALLCRLDTLRDARYLGTISEDEYHTKTDELWAELRRCDREATEADKEERRRRQQRHTEWRSGTALYCDGCYKGGQAGVGVVTTDHTIHISEQMDAATTNQAECLSVIRGVREC